MRFPEWKNEVDTLFALNYFGQTSDDFPDYDWRKAYDDDLDAEQAFVIWDREERWKYEE